MTSVHPIIMSPIGHECSLQIVDKEGRVEDLGEGSLDWAYEKIGGYGIQNKLEISVKVKR